jgi:hypothetical protein
MYGRRGCSRPRGRSHATHPRSRLQGQHPCISWGLRLATAFRSQHRDHCAQEIERNRSIASHPATVATAVAVDPGSWKLIRVQVSENEPNGTASGASYKILYLAKPLLGTLPNA